MDVQSGNSSQGSSKATDGGGGKMFYHCAKYFWHCLACCWNSEFQIETTFTKLQLFYMGHSITFDQALPPARRFVNVSAVGVGSVVRNTKFIVSVSVSSYG